MKTKRAFVLTIMVLGSVASSLPAQVASGEPQAADSTTELSEEGGADQGFGWSGALRVVLVEPGERVETALLSTLGDGWEDGHSWRLIHGSMVPSRVLGAPASGGEPGSSREGGLTGAQAGSADATGQGPEAGPKLLGVPARGAAAAEAAAVEASEELTVVAPGPAGVWRLESASGAGATFVTVVPASEKRNGRLNGYVIGEYPTRGSQSTDAYAPPTAFIEVTPNNQDLEISDHLRLGQFLTKDQFDVWPKYVALDLRLIDKLELVMAELNAMGIRAEKLHVMSGFRTPRYNGPGGDGRASLSRHMWGDAADVWIDNDDDGLMDDLNGDGRIDLNDAGVMMRAVDRVEGRYPSLVGGAGIYPTTNTHGPFIHIDTRGNRARW